ncbi:hypothetical protein [Paenibacillus monticola]|uniref:hypothetical protein n=1 Tax=Paenibacillus monticola TaxID=2666075 RepID=UPI001E40E626|nr:hypothetical protein [Paenibacillus monticola]
MSKPLLLGSASGRIMMNLWNGIGVDSWLEPYDGKSQSMLTMTSSAILRINRRASKKIRRLSDKKPP